MRVSSTRSSSGSVRALGGGQARSTVRARAASPGSSGLAAPSRGHSGKYSTVRSGPAHHLEVLLGAGLRTQLERLDAVVARLSE